MGGGNPTKKGRKEVRKPRKEGSQRRKPRKEGRKEGS